MPLPKIWIAVACLVVYSAVAQTGSEAYTREWGTYFPQVIDVAKDDSGNVWVTFLADENTDYSGIVTTDAHQSTYGGGINDGFLAKFSPEGELLYGSYFGGSNTDRSWSIDAKDGFVYLVGHTKSDAGIATPGSYQENLLATTDPNGDPYETEASFIAQFDEDGVLQWSTYFQGDRTANLVRVKAGNNSNVFVWGETASSNLATAEVFQETMAPPYWDGTEYIAPDYPILASFSDTGARQWATYFGPALDADTEVSAVGGLDVDYYNNVYVGGYSNDTSNFYGTTGAHQEENSGGLYDIFFSKFTDEGQLEWSSYYGGNDMELVPYIHVGQDDSFYVSGLTTSTNRIATPGSYQDATSGGINGFLAKFALNGQRQWGTYLETGASPGLSFPFAVNTSGSVFMMGSTVSNSGLATTGSWQDDIQGQSDRFILQLDHTGENLEWGSYYGGEMDDHLLYAGGDLILTGNNDFYFYGFTQSTENISSQNGFAEEPEEGWRGFVAKFTPCEAPQAPTVESPQAYSLLATLEAIAVETSTWEGSTTILRWYADPAGTTELPLDTLLEDGETYYVSQTIKGCDESTLVAVTVNLDITLGTELPEGNKIVLYPNPNRGSFALEGLSLGQTTLQLYDMQNRSVFETTFANRKTFPVDLQSALASGVYLLQVTSGPHSQVFRVVVE